MKRMLPVMTALALASLAISTAVFAAPRRESASLSGKADDAKTKASIRAVLDAQVAAWNRGDIDAFMDGYARSPDIVFLSGDSLTHGWQTVLDRYKKNYDSREKMGTLAFSDLEINVIAKDAAIVTGRWQLARAGDTPRGRFTLIFRRRREGWRIVHDHTSSAS